MINADTLRDRLHERFTDPRGLRAYCDNCGAGLTEVDCEAGECTNCGSVIADDESANEDQWEDPRLDEDEDDFTYDNFLDY